MGGPARTRNGTTRATRDTHATHSRASPCASRLPPEWAIRWTGSLALPWRKRGKAPRPPDRDAQSRPRPVFSCRASIRREAAALLRPGSNGWPASSLKLSGTSASTGPCSRRRAQARPGLASWQHDRNRLRPLGARQHGAGRFCREDEACPGGRLTASHRPAGSTLRRRRNEAQVMLNYPTVVGRLGAGKLERNQETWHDLRRPRRCRPAEMIASSVGQARCAPELRLNRTEGGEERTSSHVRHSENAISCAGAIRRANTHLVELAAHPDAKTVFAVVLEAHERSA